jgi:hypothetical protein
MNIHISKVSNKSHRNFFSCYVIYWFLYFTVIGNKAEERRKTIEINRDDSEKMKFFYAGKQMSERRERERYFYLRNLGILFIFRFIVLYIRRGTRYCMFEILMEDISYTYKLLRKYQKWNTWRSWKAKKIEFMISCACLPPGDTHKLWLFSSIFLFCSINTL